MKEMFWRETAEGGKKDVIPRREYELIEFYKRVLETFDVDAIEIDADSHILSFIGRQKEIPSEKP